MKNIIFYLFILLPAILTAQDLPDQEEVVTPEDTITTGDSIAARETDHTPEKTKARHEIHTISGNHQHSGGYGGLVFKGSEFNDVQILLFGIRGAWIINRALGIGIDANGIIPVSKFDNIDPAGLEQAILVGGYGGFLIEPVIWSNQVVHFTFPVSMGGGWLGYIEDWEDEWNNEWEYYSGELYSDDVFWYIEPGINIEINVATFFRIGGGISKRFTQDLQLYGTPETAFDNLNYGFVIKFGGF